MILPHTILSMFFTSQYVTSLKAKVSISPLPCSLPPHTFYPQMKKGSFRTLFRSQMCIWQKPSEIPWGTKKAIYLLSAILHKTLTTHGCVGRLPWLNLTLDIAVTLNRTSPTHGWFRGFPQPYLTLDIIGHTQQNYTKRWMRVFLSLTKLSSSRTQQNSKNPWIRRAFVPT